MGIADQVQHHVQRCGCSTGRVAVAVYDKQLGLGHNRGEVLLQRQHVRPVDAAVVAIEQTGCGQGPTAGADTTQRQALPGQRPEPLSLLGGAAERHILATTYDHCIHARGMACQ
ncbi:hypothetical protein D9M71_608130 [compost metagenome]